jgi:hypothetical protein
LRDGIATGFAEVFDNLHGAAGHDSLSPRIENMLEFFLVIVSVLVCQFIQALDDIMS